MPAQSARLAVLGASAQPLISRFDSSLVRIGRGHDNELVLPDIALSRRHAELRHSRAGWALVDLGSRNGTLLNGRAVRGTESLDPGDRITLGSTTIVFEPPETGLFRLQTGPDTDAAVLAPNGSAGRGAAPLRLPPSFVGSSAAARHVRLLIDRFAASNATVLLLGENGTGKEVAAHLIHERSARAGMPYVIVNCPAIAGTLVEPELFGTEKGVATGVDARPGRLEAAHRGTLFLDEIGDLGLSAQAKLLRFLQEHVVERVGGRKRIELDVRVIAATNQDLHDLAAAGSFRRDLLHRLDVATIEIPPLRERREDIPELCRHFLTMHGPEAPRLSAASTDCLMAHDYPGNVRELQHALQRAVLLAEGGVIEPRDLPRTIREPAARRASHLSPHATELWARVVDGGSDFWEAVRRPFLERTLPRDEVRAFVRRLHAEEKGSYKRMADRLGIGDDYRRFVDFLRHNGLRPED